jgi:hypothetical protein
VPLRATSAVDNSIWPPRQRRGDPLRHDTAPPCTHTSPRSLIAVTFHVGLDGIVSQTQRHRTALISLFTMDYATATWPSATPVIPTTRCCAVPTAERAVDRLAGDEDDGVVDRDDVPIEPDRFGRLSSHAAEHACATLARSPRRSSRAVVAARRARPQDPW